MKIIKRLSKIVLIILLTLILSYNVYNYWCINILGQDLTSVGGYAALEVITGSMEPTIHVGDLIIIDTNNKDYYEKDIVTFYDINGAFVTHRIVSINDDVLITKGDNNNTEDEAITKDRLVGKYVTKINGFGKISASLKSPFVMIMILLIGIMVCFLVSTDKQGNPILTDEEIEFKKFKEEKEKNQKKSVEK